ncbi:unnamed protein product [Pieris macdunnoughi]|uniref:Uncharacterized protein n=1 Tax=Pieris macdunnoughi TaxID=345717 RepID=A0A821XTP5_9NEOP|nr:unnamed protein product [Pieris macdunnoughi]
MEKTLPLPRIPTNVVFYKRQLWLYNCGVNVSSTNEGYCFVWVEGEAGRGAQEVGSCMIKFIKEIMRPNVERLSLWSDSCGGQNRNIKMVLLLKVILASHPTLKAKLNDLKSMFNLIPEDCLLFYKSLKGMEGPDFIEGFSSEAEYELEDQDDEELSS